MSGAFARLAGKLPHRTSNRALCALSLTHSASLPIVTLEVIGVQQNLVAISAHASTATATHCPYCAFQCGMRLTVADDAVTIVCDPDFPVTKCELCIQGVK